jgi:hypothetical protein
VDDDLAAIDAAIDTLSGWFDNITIFANRHDFKEGNTTSVWRGRGNWHARHGQVREWLLKQNTVSAVEAKRDLHNGDEA